MSKETENKKLQHEKDSFCDNNAAWATGFKANAQFVRARPAFSLGISVGPPGPAPFGGAIWSGPEWTWRGNRYVEVPGYWARPGRYHGWINGHWKYTKRGYRWVPGHWR